MILRSYKKPRPHPKVDEPYKSWIRLLPCVVCFTWRFRIAGYSGMVECAHVGERGLGQKCHDRQTLPLCVFHHRTGPHSAHAIGKRFWGYWKLDRFELIADHNRRYEREHHENAA